mgnify:FL=1
MTNEDMLDDLKQYIDLKTDALETNLEAKLKKHINDVVSESTETILDAIGNRVEKIEDTFGSHEKKKKKLETRVA